MANGVKFKRIEPITRNNTKPRYYFNGSIDSLIPVKRTGIVSQERPVSHVKPVVKKEERKINIPQHSTSEVLFCIFNYRKDENARRWVKILSPYFKTIVLDSGNDKKCEDFIQFPNIYYSGLFNEMKKIQEKDHYQWVGIITSDVEIDDDNAKKLIEKIKWLQTTSNVGVYSILGDLNGHSNKYQYATISLGKFRFAEGFFQIISGEILDSQPFVDTSINKYGYGIDYFTCFISAKKGYMIYIDENISIFHPKDKGYDADKAIICQKNFYKTIKKNYFNDFEVAINNFAARDENIDGNKNIRYSTNNSDNFGLSIIITAFNVQDYIAETLESIYSQSFIKNNRNYEVLIGIDWCEKTLESVKNVMRKYPNIKVLMMNSNKGTFVTSNTLIKEAKYNKILRFDSDDLMIPGMLEKIMEASKKYDIVRFWYDDYYGPNEIKHILACAYGSVLYDKKVFTECGGYKSWKCSGDYELFSRVMRHFKVTEIKESLYNHRIRSNSLMHQADTAMNSEYRKKVNATVRVYRTNENIYIVPEYNTFTEIYSNYIDINGYDDTLANIYTSPTLRFICDCSDRKQMFPEYSETERYIISMTSWKMRIGNVKPVIESLLAGNIKPDLVVINLAEEEFPNKEGDLPKDLVGFINNNSNIELHWVIHNTKVWKKILPTIMRYPNDCIIGIDDDFEYPADFLETLKNEHLKKPNVGISGNKEAVGGVKAHCGCGTLVKYNMFGNKLNTLNKEMYGAAADDLFYTYAMNKNKHHYEFCGTLFFLNMPKFNEIEGYSKSNTINVANIWRRIYQPLLKA